MLMPHESTVNPFGNFGEEVHSRRNTRASCMSESSGQIGSDVTALVASNQAAKISSDAFSAVAAAATATALSNSNQEEEKTGRRPITPAELTHHEDFDDDDEDSDESKRSTASTPPLV